MLAKVINGSIREYPLTHESYQQAIEQGLNDGMTAEDLAQLNLVRVVTDPVPTDVYKYVPATVPVLVNGQWTIIWQKDENTSQDIMATRSLNVARSQRRNRDYLIQAVQWRFERYNRLARLNQPQVDDIAVLDAYVQALADITLQEGWPFNVIWPSVP